jgi:aspartate aminotransferase-like enzyme
MPSAELSLPARLLAGGGPSTPDPRVLRALATPLIGQFDPDFTAVMDDVVQLGRATFLTQSPHCFAVSAMRGGALEAVFNTLVEGDAVAIGGSAGFVKTTAEIVRRGGGQAVAMDSPAPYVVVPCVEPYSGTALDLPEFAKSMHARGSVVIVEATAGLGACELRVDDWQIDVCVAGADYALGAPSGMSLVTYSPAINARMLKRAAPPKTSYLDLVQLQAYWSPERLNHHTAPTSLVYGMREALRLVQLEGLTARWERHTRIGQALHTGLRRMGLEASGEPPYAIVRVPPQVDAERAWTRLLEEYGIHVARIAPRTWRLGLLGADARIDNVNHVLNALEQVLAA